MTPTDVLIAGGGLQAGLVALAVLARRPDASVVILERDARLGGNHLWSFHLDEVPPGLRAAVEELIVARWDRTEVIFPGLRRGFDRPYASISSERLDEVVRARLAARRGCAILTGVTVSAVTATGVVLADGRRLHGRRVIDARGPEARPAELAGYQKFVGLEVELARDHGLEHATLMDATVAQVDGFRFLYTLPLGPRRLLVEDTRFSDTPALDVEELRAGLLAHLARAGWQVAAVGRVEHGVLPLPLRGAGPSIDGDGALVAGYQGGWFHPTTGYSFPVAARLAWAAAAPPPEDEEELAVLAAATRRQVRFAHLLNRLLFHATPPGERWRVLERFHHLPDATVARFYALAMTRADRMRLLCGRPPAGVSLRAALAALESP